VSRISRAKGFLVLPGVIDDFQDSLPIIMHVARVEELRVKSNSNLQAQHPQFSLTSASCQNKEIHSLASACFLPWRIVHCGLGFTITGP
jgi:hypothetical protein